MGTRLTPLTLLVSVLLISSGDGKNQYIVKRIYLDNWNPKIVINVTQSFKLLTRNQHSYNATLYMTREYLNTFIVRVAVEKRIRGVYKPFLLNTTFNYCTQKLLKKKNVIFEETEKYYNKFTTINRTCPLQTPLLIRNYHVDSNYIAQVIPNGEYRVWNIGNTKVDGKLEKIVDLIVLLHVRNQNDYYDLA